MHNWFRLKVSAASNSGSMIEISERRALCRGWWLLGAILALPAALATKSVWVALLVFVVPEGFLVTMGAIIAAETLETDRRRLKNFMSRMLSAQEVA